MTPLERAAQAVRDEIAIPHGDGTFVVEGGFREDQFFRDVARAVIEAIRKPSEAQSEAVGTMLEREGMYMDCAPSDVWLPMIDTLLEQGR